jgi:hypothetical protein
MDFWIRRITLTFCEKFINAVELAVLTHWNLPRQNQEKQNMETVFRRTWECLMISTALPNSTARNVCKNLAPISGLASVCIRNRAIKILQKPMSKNICLRCVSTCAHTRRGPRRKLWNNAVVCTADVFHCSAVTMRSERYLHSLL